MDEEPSGTGFSQGEMRRFTHQLGMKPLKTGHVPAKAEPARQQLFLEDRLSPLLAKAGAGECHLFFMDAAHFVCCHLLAYCDAKARVFIKASAGRNRINVLGVFDAFTLKMETVVSSTYVNSETVVEMLRKLADRFRTCRFTSCWTMQGTSTVILSRNWPRRLEST